MLTDGLDKTLRVFDLMLAAVLAATEKFDTLLALLLLRSMAACVASLIQPDTQHDKLTADCVSGHVQNLTSFWSRSEEHQWPNAGAGGAVATWRAAKAAPIRRDSMNVLANAIRVHASVGAGGKNAEGSFPKVPSFKPKVSKCLDANFALQSLDRRTAEWSSHIPGCRSPVYAGCCACETKGPCIMRNELVLGARNVSDTETESQVSYASGPKSIKPTVKAAWKGGKKVNAIARPAAQWHSTGVTLIVAVLQVDEENFLHMQEEYYRLKQTEKSNEETMRQ